MRDAVRSMPFYLNGRPHQRKLVLQWLEESYGSKEPVAPDTLTIEHVHAADAHRRSGGRC